MFEALAGLSGSQISFLVIATALFVWAAPRLLVGMGMRHSTRTLTPKGAIPYQESASRAFVLACMATATVLMAMMWVFKEIMTLR